MKKILLRLLLLAVAAITTLVVLFYVWTDWAGARRWKAVESRLRAAGEPLTIAEIEPQPIADDLNFAAASIFAEIAKVPDRDQWRISAIHSFAGAAKPGSSPLANAARKVDPAFAGSDKDAAQVILGETSKWKPLFDEIHAAAQRPGTVWPTDYRLGFRMKIDQASVLLRIAQALSTEAKAFLEVNRPEDAQADFQLLMNLALRSQEPPIAITYLVRQAITEQGVEVVRYGIERRAWKSAQLKLIQHEFADTSLLPSLARALRAERITFVDSVGKLSSQDAHDIVTHDDSNTESLWQRLKLKAMWKLRPAGWSNEDRSGYAEIMQSMIAWLDNPYSCSPKNLPDADRLVAEMRSSPLSLQHNFFTMLSLPALLPLVPKAARQQANVEAAQLSCAIERYRLAKGALPATLQALQPDFLARMPLDPIGGAPFHYRATGPDSYVLYSVGWNGVDDHGSDKRPSPKAFEKAEDWVWKMGPAE